jgi:hypothetical protein
VTGCERSGIDPGLHTGVEPGLSASLALGRHSSSCFGEARGGARARGMGTALQHPSR